MWGQAGFGAFKAVDGLIHGGYGTHGEHSYTGWAYGPNQAGYVCMCIVWTFV
jgi:hypothetical protein